MLQSPVTETIELLTQLRKKGISLWEENGKLRYKAPQGILKTDDLQALKDHKKKLLRLLETEAKSVKVVPDPGSRFEPFPLTDIQSAYLLGRHEAFGYGGVACHIYLELSYPELDPKRSEAVWNQLVLRHEMLRAIIDPKGHQQILKSVPLLKISYVDASSTEEQTMVNILAEIREKMGYRIYDNEHWPLFDIAITKKTNEAVLHFSMDFLIADWASMWLLISEFETLYEDPETRLPKLDLSFRDYLMTERGLRETPAYHRDKAYWFDRVDSLPPAPDLPLAPRQKDDSGTICFRRWFLHLDKPTWEKLTRYAQNRGLTPTAVVITAYAAIMGKWSRNKKFTLNMTVLNRLDLHSQVNDIVGDFTTINLLSVDWQAGNSFTGHAEALGHQLFEDLEHRSFSGVEVMREIGRRRGREVALMPIVFTSAIGLGKNNRLKGKFKGDGITQTPQVFIDCQAMDDSGGLQVNWDVRQGVFPEQMVDDMFDAFEQLLRSLAGADEIWDAGDVVTLPAWQQSERDKVNATETPLTEQLLHQQILAQAAATPDRPAVFDSQGQLTYRELVQNAAAVAKELKEMGCETQERVAVAMEKSAHQVAAVLGALSAGAVYVPIDVNQPELRRSAMLEQAKIKFILTASTTQIPWPENIKTIAVDKLEPSRENILIAEGDPALPAYVIYTSGSTGTPKGVVVSHRAALNTITDINHRFEIHRDDRVLGLAQLSFDLSVYDIFGPLSVGGALVYPSAERVTDPSHWAELMIEHEVTMWDSVPALMQMLLAYLNSEQKTTLSKLRLVLLSGDWIPLSMPDMVGRYLSDDARIIALGGATEASVWSNYHIYEGLRDGWQSIPYGRPLSNQGFRILDSQMRDCPVWVKGELYITGQGLAEGYINDDETTQEWFSPHPADGQRLYRTGDMGRYLPGGEIEFLGREDNQVKIKGHRIELGEIESILQKHPAVAAAAAVVAVDSNESKTLLGFIEANPRQSVQESELADFLTQYLPGYMIPSRLQVVDALPLTPNGKIDRHKLATWRPDPIAEEPPVAKESSDNLEAELARLCAEALGIPSIGVSENFFDHGADSLLVAQISGKVRDMLAEDPSREEIPFDSLLQQILNSPTVASLAQFIRSHEKEPKRALDEPKPTPVFSPQTSSNSMVPSYGGGETGPLRVVFHAALGTMTYFRFLLSHLERQNLGPVIGIAIEDPDQYCRAAPSGLIEQVADDYTQRLLENGHEQIQLIGYSLGGLIAVEVARRLLEKGISLSDLVLIDSTPMFYDIDDEIILEALFLEHFHVTLAQIGSVVMNTDDLVRGCVQIVERNNCIAKGSSGTIGGDEGLDKVGEFFQRLSALDKKERFTLYVNAIAKSTDEQIPVEVAEVLFKVFRQSTKAARFTPRPLMADIRLLQARGPYSFLPSIQQKVLMYWRETCLGEFTVLEIEGNHISCIEEEPQVSQVAKLIADPLVL
jgi:pyochelin synthetase